MFLNFSISNNMLIFHIFIFVTYFYTENFYFCFVLTLKMWSLNQTVNCGIANLIGPTETRCISCQAHEECIGLARSPLLIVELRTSRRVCIGNESVIPIPNHKKLVFCLIKNFFTRLNFFQLSLIEKL